MGNTEQKMLRSTGYQVCTRCVMDTTVPEIVFDANGVCQYCMMHDELDKEFPSQAAVRQQLLEQVVAKIKKAGEGKKYDCICGTSGGRDSTWVLYNAKKLGLRPLAVHFDNGWNSDIAVRNIKNTCEKLNIELETIVINWEEFKDLQVAFLKASVPDVEVPTDVMIFSVLHYVAAKEGVKYILNGHSFRTEGISPLGWTYIDGRYIDAIHSIFGKRKLKDYMNFRLKELFYYRFIKRIEVIPILNYVEYQHAPAQAILEKELGWQYYGGHHHESFYTKFIQSYLLPKKFNIDKRKTELSALIRSGYTTRDHAIAELNASHYKYDAELIDYVIPKLGLTKAEWNEIFNQKPKSFKDYPSYYGLMRLLRTPTKLLCSWGILPRLLYLKYLSI